MMLITVSVSAQITWGPSPAANWWFQNYLRVEDGLQLGEHVAPPTPVTGYGLVYAKSDGYVYYKNDAGTEYNLVTAGPTAVTGLNTQQVLYGKSDGTIDQEAGFYYDEAQDLVTVVSSAGGYYVDNGTDLSLLSYNAVTFMDNSKMAGYFVDRVEMTDGTYLITLRYPTTPTAGYTLYLPPSQGASGTFLRNDGSGNTSWVSAVTTEVDGSTTNEVQNLSYDAGNHEIDISLSGTSATIPLAAADGSTLGLSAFSSSGFTASSGVVSQETQMSITTDASGLKLSGDQTSPGNYKSYGTNSTGTKGWYDHAGFTLQFSGAQFNPSDGGTVYVGCAPQAQGNTVDRNRLYIPFSGTITSAYICFQQTAGDATTSTIYLRYNNTTDLTISSSVVNNAAFTTVSTTGLSQAVSAGDYIELKWVCPTWPTTDPTQVKIWGVVGIRPN